jgi:hypothetical protein
MEMKMTKLKINITGTNVEYEGDEKFLRTDVPDLIEAVKKSHNEQVKKQLSATIEDLQRNLLAMDAFSESISYINEESTQIVNDFCSKILSLLRSIEKLADKKEDLLDAIKQIILMQQKFNLQYRQLQDKMQNENRQYTTISNVMKTKHDAAKSTINNIR